MTSERSTLSDARAERRAATELIRRCLSRSGPPDAAELRRLLTITSESTLLASAAHHRTQGWLHECLRNVPGVSDRLVAELKAARNWAAQRHMHAMWQLDRLRPALDDSGVPWVVFKGPILADVLHGSAGRRTYDDLDVLVHPAGFRRVIDVVEGLGGRLMDRNWDLLRRERRGQVHLALHGGLELDLHWDLVNVHRRRMLIDTSAVLDRRTVIRVSNLDLPTLDPTDSLIHLAVHAAVSGGDGLVWLKDIERAVAHRSPDWADVVERSRAWGVSGSVGLMLDRARRMLDAEVPVSIPVDLVGGRRIRLVRAVDRWSPPGVARGGPVPDRVMARALGHGLVGGLMVLLRRGMRHFDPRGQDRYSAFTPGGSTADREAFFAEVGLRTSLDSPPVADAAPSEVQGHRRRKE